MMFGIQGRMNRLRDSFKRVNRMLGCLAVCGSFLTEADLHHQDGFFDEDEKSGRLHDSTQRISQLY
jgi:hypothetical protein